MSRKPAPPMPGTDAEGEGDTQPSPFAFLADRDAFVRRFVLSMVLAPPPGRRRPRSR
jgi:hypothetical protein